MIAARSCVSGKARTNSGRDARYVITDVTRPPQRPLPNGRDEALPRPCDGWSGWLRRRRRGQRHVAGRGGVSARGGRLRAADRVGRGPDQRAGGAKIIKSGRLLHTKYPEPLRTKRWKARTTLNEKDAEHFVRSTAIGLGHYLEVGFLAACDNLQPHGARFKEISLHAGQ